MHKSLVKLVDISLLPASIMVLSKIAGLALTSFAFNLPIGLTQIPSVIFTVRPVVLPEDLQTLSTYSDIMMYVFLAISFSLVLVQAAHFHDTHINPSLLIKLSNRNLLGLVKSSFDIYHTATIWIIFLWLGFLAITINVLLDKTLAWVGIAALISNIVFTSILLQDVYHEIDTTRRNLGNQQALQ